MTNLLTALLLAIGAAASAAAGDVEQVTIVSEGAVSIAGEYRHAGAGSAAVLFFSMCGSPDGLQGWSPVADLLRARGVSSLVINFKGSRDHWKADGAAAIAYLRSRIGSVTPLAAAGSSCGVSMALITAANHPDTFRAVATLTGPYGSDALAFVRRSPGLAVYSGASENDGPAPGWARELRAASSNPDSKLVLLPTLAHGTDLFRVETSLAPEMSEWLAARLSGRRVAGPPTVSRIAP